MSNAWLCINALALHDADLRRLTPNEQKSNIITGTSTLIHTNATPPRNNANNNMYTSRAERHPHQHECESGAATMGNKLEYSQPGTRNPTPQTLTSTKTQLTNITKTQGNH